MIWEFQFKCHGVCSKNGEISFVKRLLVLHVTIAWESSAEYECHSTKKVSASYLRMEFITILTMLESTPFIMCSTTRKSTQHLCEIPYDIYLSPIIIVYTDANYSAGAF